MNPDDLTPGTAVRVVTDRIVAFRSWLGAVGEVFGHYRRGEIRDWCLVKITDHSTIILGFAPDELVAP